MIREICYFFRHGPRIKKLQAELGLAEFLKRVSKELDADGFAELRTSLVGDLEGDILEIGTGTGATFPYYKPKAKVTAMEPDEELCAAAEEAAKSAVAEIKVLAGVGEDLPRRRLHCLGRHLHAHGLHQFQRYRSHGKSKKLHYPAFRRGLKLGNRPSTPFFIDSMIRSPG